MLFSEKHGSFQRESLKSAAILSKAEYKVNGATVYNIGCQ